MRHQRLLVQRAHRKSGSHDERMTLRKESDAAKREVTDLRKLNSAQEVALAARTESADRLQAKIDDLSNALEEMEEANGTMEGHVEAADAAQRDAEKALADLTEIRTQLQDDLSNRETLIRMLEAQVGTHQKAADMANANAQDLQRGGVGDVGERGSQQRAKTYGGRCRASDG